LYSGGQEEPSAGKVEGLIRGKGKTKEKRKGTGKDRKNEHFAKIHEQAEGQGDSEKSG